MAAAQRKVAQCDRDGAARQLRGQQPHEEGSQNLTKKLVETTTTTTTTATRVAGTSAEQFPGEQVESVAHVEDLGRQATASSVEQTATRRRAGDESEPLSGREGNKLVTTISTIAAQSGKSRIVVAILKDGLALKLRVQEMRPDIFEVGMNLIECNKYLEEHKRLVRNMHKQKLAPIECWMDKYKRIEKSQASSMTSEMKLVYMCMAENLQGCWRSLLAQLEQRSQLLEETRKFYECSERLLKALDNADNHVQVYRQEFLNGLGANVAKFSEASKELKRLNQLVSDEFLFARRKQQQVIKLIGTVMASENFGNYSNEHFFSDGQSLINYIGSYLDSFERRKLQLESVLKTSTTSKTVTTTTATRTDNLARQVENNSLRQTQFKSIGGGSCVLREITSFNDLNLVENWLNVKVEQLNSSLLSSLGAGAQDSRSILSKHEQIALECSAIEEATLKFNGKNIYAIKSTLPADQQDADKQPNGALFERQKTLAVKVRDVITILDARIVLLRRTIDFYSKAKDSTGDINKMMRRLQVDNSLQSVQFVADELELKDVSSVIASGATIISELQQLQLAQQRGQRSKVVELNLQTNGIRTAIDQLNQDLVHLKTVLNQRRLVLLNEDSTKMANNFSNKCQQLKFWLENNVKNFLLTNNRVPTEPSQAKQFCDEHEQLRVAVQNKTLEVEALLRSLATLSKSFDAKSKTADELQRDTDELRQNWINVTSCLDKRIELIKKFLTLVGSVGAVGKELDSLERIAFGKQSAVASDGLDERSGDEIKTNVDQLLAQLSNQVKNFSADAQKVDTSLLAHLHSLDAKQTLSDINKQLLVDHVNGLFRLLGERKKRATNFAESSSLGKRRQQRTSAAKRSTKGTAVPPPPPQQSLVDSGNKRTAAGQSPKFIRQLVDKDVEPFSTVELDCELDSIDEEDCKVEWFMGTNTKRIPPNVKHSTFSEGSCHRLVISQFNPIHCGLYTIRATNLQSGASASSSCKLRLRGIVESQHEADESWDEPEVVETSKQVQAAAAPRRGVEPIKPGNSGTVNSRSSRVRDEPQANSISPAAISSASSFSQWRPAAKTTTATDTISSTETSERTIERIIQGVESPASNKDEPLLGGSRIKRQATTNSTKNNTLTIDNKNELPVTQTFYSGQITSAPNATGNSGTGDNRNNRLRVSYSQSPAGLSSASDTLSTRSVSRSPFQGSPQAPIFVEGLNDSLERSCSRAGLVCVVIGNPPPTIEWLHNNRPIATAKCQKPAAPSGPHANVCKLTIETINDKTQGQYACKATNRLGQTTTMLRLNK